MRFFESQSVWPERLSPGDETWDSPRDISGCAGRSLVFKSSTWHSSIAVLERFFVLGPLLCPCLSSVTLCARLWCGWQSTLPSLSSSAPSSTVQVVMGAHYASFCISCCFWHPGHTSPWVFAALLIFAVFSSLLVCAHHLSLPLAAEAGGVAANEWSKNIANASHQETLQRNLLVPFQ